MTAPGHCGILTAPAWSPHVSRFRLSVVLLSVGMSCLSACGRMPESAADAMQDATSAVEAPEPTSPPVMPKTPPLTMESLLRPDDTLASAQERLGATAVEARELDGPEGETFQGWVLYPGDPKRSIDVILDDAGAHPIALRVRGDAAGAWTRADGVRIGLDSGALQALNGTAFEFSGFDWDYGGYVLDWKGGKLDPGDAPRGSVGLCPPENAPTDYPAGDQAFLSSDPKLLSHPAHVCEFMVVIAR